MDRCYHRRACEDVLVVSKPLSTYRALWGFQHTRATNHLARCFTLVHFGVNALVHDALELCGFGDCVKLVRNFLAEALVSASTALTSMSTSTRAFFAMVSRVAGSHHDALVSTTLAQAWSEDYGWKTGRTG